ncbi:hypothetical protein PHAVU_005G118301 [Phaseolus vulgaris]
MFSTPFVLTFSLLLSLPILFFLAPRILPPKPHSLPISPSDELDDINLFNRAITLANSHATTNPSKFFHLSSKNPSLKIAFLFLTNTDLHFSPLWDLFFHDTPSYLFNIYIHADPSVNITRSLLSPSSPTNSSPPNAPSAPPPPSSPPRAASSPLPFSTTPQTPTSPSSPSTASPSTPSPTPTAPSSSPPPSTPPIPNPPASASASSTNLSSKSSPTLPSSGNATLPAAATP